MKTIIAALLATSMSAYAQEPTDSEWLAMCRLRATFALGVAQARKEGLPVIDVKEMFDASRDDPLLIAIAAVYAGPQPDPERLYWATLEGCMKPTAR